MSGFIKKHKINCRYTVMDFGYDVKRRGGLRSVASITTCSFGILRMKISVEEFCESEILPGIPSHEIFISF